MRRLLIITLLDYKREPNGRIHHLVVKLGRRFEKVVVLHGTFARPGPVWRVLLGSLCFTARATGDGSLREIRVSPFLNYPESLAKRAAGYPASTAGRWRSVRLALEKFLSTLGILRDISWILSFFAAMCLHARGPFEVVLVQCPLTGIVGLLARRLGFAQCLVYDDIDYAPGWCDHGLRRRWIGGLEAVSLASADRVISCGHRLATLRRSQTGQAVPVVPNGVNLAMFGAAQGKIPHVPTVIYMGRVTDWAGLEVAFRAIAGLREKIPDLRFLVVGRSDPAYDRILRSLVSGLGVTDAVEFVGEAAYEDLPKFLRQSDVGVAAFRPNPMKDFAFPLKVVEYMAAGLPVIGIRDTETARIIQEHDAGLVVEFTPESVGGAIHSLLTDRHLYARYAANAARSSSSYDWQRLMDREYDEIGMAHAGCRRILGRG